MNYNTALYALGAILLGVIGIIFHDFHLQWQAVPESIPRIPYAYVSAAILALAGCALLVRRYERIGALMLAVFYGLWVIAFHLPNAIAAWRIMGMWNPPAEITFMAMGGLSLWAVSAGPASRVLKLVARVLAGVSAIVFGLVHMSYIKETAEFVPAWIPPSRVFWAWATGAGHLAAGLALVSGIQARLAAMALTGMMASFVLLVHIPRIFGSPDSRFEWTMLGFAASLTGAAWLIRKYST
jgi:uncharacterized membrane protein YphA (DoxX/SURF4 family)